MRLFTVFCFVPAIFGIAAKGSTLLRFRSKDQSKRRTASTFFGCSKYSFWMGCDETETLSVPVDVTPECFAPHCPWTTIWNGYECSPLLDRGISNFECPRGGYLAPGRKTGTIHDCECSLNRPKDTCTHTCLPEGAVPTESSTVSELQESNEQPATTEPCSSAYSCPDNSLKRAGIDCPRSFDDCECSSGFEKRDVSMTARPCENHSDCNDATNAFGLSKLCGNLSCSNGKCKFNAWQDSGDCVASNFLECGGKDALCTKGPSAIPYQATCTGWAMNECIYVWEPLMPSIEDPSLECVAI